MARSSFAYSMAMDIAALPNVGEVAGEPDLFEKPFGYIVQLTIAAPRTDVPRL